MIPASNKLEHVNAWLRKEIHLDDSTELDQMIRILNEDILGLSSLERMMQGQRINESGIMRLQRAIPRLNNQEPVQYVTGVSYFYGLELDINPSALIPRPETEELVGESLKYLQNLSNPVVVDACSGSGCIALAIKNNLSNSSVMGIEKSSEAVKLARQNQQKLGVDLQWMNEDLFDDIWKEELYEKVDLLVSNPPYIPWEELEQMNRNVKDFEPKMALFVPNEEPLLFYNRLADVSQEVLKEGGKLLCEVHEEKALEVKNLFEEKGLKFVEVIKDMQGKNRMVCAIR